VACDNGRRIAWGTLDGKVMVWDGPPDFFTMATVCWAFSAPSVPILASPWPAAEARPTHVLPAHSSRVMSVAFAPDGRRLASCGIDGVIKVWDLDGKGWTVRFGLSGHLGAVHGVAFSSDGRRLASAGLDGTIRLWDMEAGKEYSELRGHTNSVYTVVYSPDGRYLASGGSDGTIRIWDANPMSSGGRTAP
jgi:WD40 repeat protein